jgi:hypothetical protein
MTLKYYSKDCTRDPNLHSKFLYLHEYVLISKFGCYYFLKVLATVYCDTHRVSIHTPDEEWVLLLVVNIVTYRPIARQRLSKHIPVVANGRNNRTSIARQRISKHA